MAAENYLCLFVEEVLNGWQASLDAVVVCYLKGGLVLRAARERNENVCRVG